MVAVPDGEGGVGFDDLGFVAELGEVLVPAGRTGHLDLYDPASRQPRVLDGFSTRPPGGRGHGEGTTSADFGRGLLFAVDRSAERLDVVDPATGKIVGWARLTASPDYVRWVAPSREIWVTEPEAEKIEIFKLAGEGTELTALGGIGVPGGPEALVIDAARGSAYTNLWSGKSVTIDLNDHKTVAPWPNGCEGSRGLALDAARGLLFVGCAEGKATVIDVAHENRILDTLAAADGVDVIAYDAARRHLYLAGGRSATLAILGVGDGGKLALLATAETAKGSHCVTVDDHRQAWVCDPTHGRLLVVEDTAP